jgi:malate synthase
MKVTLEGKPEEIEKLLNAIGGSKEQLDKIGADTAWLRKRFTPMDPKVYRQKLLEIVGKQNSNDRN